MISADFRACVTIPDDENLRKEIGIYTIPEGKYAVITLKGSIQHEFKCLIAFRHGWLDQSGYQVAEITGFGIYSENPATEPYESISRQIFIPVKPA